MWFYFDGLDFTICRSQEEARKRADDALADYRIEAVDGWADEAMNICWGQIEQHAEVTMQREQRPDDMVDADIDVIMEIKLCDCSQEARR